METNLQLSLCCDILTGFQEVSCRCIFHSVTWAKKFDIARFENILANDTEASCHLIQ